MPSYHCIFLPLLQTNLLFVVLIDVLLPYHHRQLNRGYGEMESTRVRELYFQNGNDGNQANRDNKGTNTGQSVERDGFDSCNTLQALKVTVPAKKGTGTIGTYSDSVTGRYGGNHYHDGGQDTDTTDEDEPITPPPAGRTSGFFGKENGGNGGSGGGYCPTRLPDSIV